MEELEILPEGTRPEPEPLKTETPQAVPPVLAGESEGGPETVPGLSGPAGTSAVEPQAEFSESDPAAAGEPETEEAPSQSTEAGEPATSDATSEPADSSARATPNAAPEPAPPLAEPEPDIARSEAEPPAPLSELAQGSDPESPGAVSESLATLPEPEPPVADSEAAAFMDELLASSEPAPDVPLEDSQLRAVLEAIVYVAEEPLTLAQMSTALQQPADRIRALLEQLVAEFDKPEHGVTIREVAGGYKMATKAEHHEAVRSFVKSLKPPLKLSLPALETLAVIAYKQPVTSPEIMEIRGVRGAGVLNTLLDRKLIAAAGRKNVIGKPILYKTTKEFLIQFGLKDLLELPSLKEFEEIRRMAFADSEVGSDPQPDEPATAHTPETEPGEAVVDRPTTPPPVTADPTDAAATPTQVAEEGPAVPETEAGMPRPPGQES